MTNQELELKLKELLNIRNYCEYAIAVKQFEKQYKQTDFYKTSKMPLKKALMEMRIHCLFNIDNLLQKTQYFINNLDTEKVQEIISNLGETFAVENAEISQSIELLNEIMNGNNNSNN